MSDSNLQFYLSDSSETRDVIITVQGKGFADKLTRVPLKLSHKRSHSLSPQRHSRKRMDEEELVGLTKNASGSDLGKASSVTVFNAVNNIPDGNDNCGNSSLQNNSVESNKTSGSRTVSDATTILNSVNNNNNAEPCLDSNNSSPRFDICAENGCDDTDDLQNGTRFITCVETQRSTSSNTSGAAQASGSSSYSRSSSPKTVGIERKPSNLSAQSTSAGAKFQSVLNATQRFLTPTYKTRAEEFRKLFKDIPDTERFVIDYSCALQKDILVQGRMYISVNYVCFYANFLKWETNLRLNLKDVASITKEKTAKVIPNAIQIITKSGEKYFFSSFTSREKTFLIMFKLWQYALVNEPISPAELITWAQGYGFDDEEFQASLTTNVSDVSVAECALTATINSQGNADVEPVPGSDGAMVYEETGAISTSFLAPLKNDRCKASTPSSAFSSTSIPAITSTGAAFGYPANASKGAVAFTVGDGGETMPESGLGHRPPGSAPELLLAGTVSSSAPTSFCRTDSGAAVGKHHALTIDTGTKKFAAEGLQSMSLGSALSPLFISQTELSDSSDAETDVGCSCSSHIGKEVLNASYPVSTDQLFLLLFTDTPFYRNLQEFRKTTDLVLSDWYNDEATGTKSRQITYTVALNNPMGPKTAAVSEKQLVGKDCIPGRFYQVSTEAQNSGIPYADSFVVLTTYCISRVSGSQSRLRVHSGIQYKKSCWALVKNFIEKNALAGIQDYYQDLDSRLRLECQRLGLLPSSGAGSPVKRSHRRGTRSRTDRSEQKDRGNTSAYTDAAEDKKAGIVYPLVTTEMERLARGILAVLVVMLLLNAVLFFKLWFFNSTSSSQTPASDAIDLKLLDDLAKLMNQKDGFASKDWLKLWVEQRLLQKRQNQKLLKLFEDSLDNIEAIETALVILKQKLKNEHSSSAKQLEDTLTSTDIQGSTPGSVDQPPMNDAQKTDVCSSKLDC